MSKTASTSLLTLGILYCCCSSQAILHKSHFTFQTSQNLSCIISDAHLQTSPYLSLSPSRAALRHLASSLVCIAFTYSFAHSRKARLLSNLLSRGGISAEHQTATTAAPQPVPLLPLSFLGLNTSTLSTGSSTRPTCALPTGPNTVYATTATSPVL